MNCLVLFIFFPFYGICVFALALPVDFLQPTDSDAVETPCVNFAPLENPNFPIQPLTTIFVTLGSRAFFRGYFEMFNGRPAVSEDELAHLCPVLFYTHLTMTKFASGNKILVADSPSGPIITQNMTVYTASPSVTQDLVEATTETIVWTNTDHFLLAGCNGNGIKVWALFSLKLPNSDIKKIVLAKITTLGFNQTYAWDLTNPGQTGSPFYCPSTPPSFAEASLQALDILGLFNDKSVLYEPLDSTTNQTAIEWQGQEYTRIYDYFKSFLVGLTPFMRSFSQNCHGAVNTEEIPGKSLPMGCQLFGPGAMKS